MARKTNASAWAHRHLAQARGSSPAVLLRSVGSYVGIAHFRNPSGVYDHCFYEFAASPPRDAAQLARFMFNTSDRIQLSRACTAGGTLVVATAPATCSMETESRSRG